MRCKLSPHKGRRVYILVIWLEARGKAYPYKSMKGSLSSFRSPPYGVGVVEGGTLESNEVVDLG